jgi:hypothetical protein
MWRLDMKHVFVWDVTPRYEACRCLRCDASWVSLEPTAYNFRVEKLSELGTALAVTSVLTRATRRDITEDGILHSHCSAYLKSYKSE